MSPAWCCRTAKVPSTTDVVAYVGLVEVVAFLVLLIVHRLAVGAGLVEPNAVESAV